MAVNDFKVISHGAGVRSFLTEDRTTSSLTTAIQPGEPCKLQSEGAIYVIPLVDGDPEAGTDEMVGIAASVSTEAAATTEGTVLMTLCQPVRTLLRAKATTPANINTAAKLKAIVNNWVSCDETGAGTNGPTGVFTIDESEASDEDVHGFRVMDGDIAAGTLDFLIHSTVSLAGPQG